MVSNKKKSYDEILNLKDIRQLSSSSLILFKSTKSLTYLVNLDSPKKLGCHWSHLKDSAGQCLSLHQRRGVGQLFFLDKFACHPGGHGSLAWWNDDPNPGVTAASHCASPRIHHKTHQKAVPSNRHSSELALQMLSQCNKNFLNKFYKNKNSILESQHLLVCKQWVQCMQQLWVKCGDVKLLM